MEVCRILNDSDYENFISFIADEFPNTWINYNALLAKYKYKIELLNLSTDLCIGYFIDNELVGFVAAGEHLFEPNTLYVAGFTVAKAHRNKGIGKKMLEYGYKMLKDSKYTSYIVGLDGELASTKDYFLKLGYKVIETKYDFSTTQQFNQFESDHYKVTPILSCKTLDLINTDDSLTISPSPQNALFKAEQEKGRQKIIGLKCLTNNEIVAFCSYSPNDLSIFQLQVSRQYAIDQLKTLFSNLRGQNGYGSLSFLAKANKITIKYVSMKDAELIQHLEELGFTKKISIVEIISPKIPS